MNFQEIAKLSQLCLLVTDGTHDSPKLQEKGMPFIKAKQVKDGSIDFENCDYITVEEHLKVIARSKPEYGDTLLVNIGAGTGQAAYVKTRKPFSIKNVALFKPDKSKIDCRYLFYYVLSPLFQSRIQSILSGSAQPFVGLDTLRNITINYQGNLQVQHKIAAILSAYDDLIENNTRRIKVLEEMAGLVYREWFVNFRFPGHEGVRLVASELGEIPEGWAFLPVGELLEHYVGGGWGKETAEEKHTLPAYVIRGTDVPEARHGDTKNVPLRYHTDSNLRSRRLKEGDIIFEVSGGSKDQPVGRALLVNAHLLGSFDEDVICAST